VEDQTRKKIKVLSLENRGEYTSNEFKTLCKEVGIKREMTTPFNPWKNGVS
jgi:transposase InsO family protein